MDAKTEAKQRIADPAKQEVVVSLDGINRETLDGWHDMGEQKYGSVASRVAIRVARAAREQLGEVQ